MMGIMRDDDMGGELNIVLDNCSGQNKNNTVLKLLVWLSEMGYFWKVNYIFLVVGHTQNWLKDYSMLLNWITDK